MIIIIIMRLLGFMVLHLNLPVKMSFIMLRASRISAHIFCLNAMKTAISVPMCSAMVVNTASSPLTPKKCWKSER